MKKVLTVLGTHSANIKIVSKVKAFSDDKRFEEKSSVTAQNRKILKLLGVGTMKLVYENVVLIVCGASRLLEEQKCFSEMNFTLKPCGGRAQQRITSEMWFEG